MRTPAHDLTQPSSAQAVYSTQGTARARYEAGGAP
jgi:hypothetical protein